MDDEDARQQEEIQVLKAIFESDFLESPTDKPWKGVGSMRGFSIRVRHTAQQLRSKFLLHLNFQLPRTYPSRAVPTVRIVKPIVGISPSTIENVESILKREIQSSKGSDMLFHLITVCQDLIADEYPDTRHPEPLDSLAAEMSQRATRTLSIERQEKEKLDLVQEERDNDAAQQLAHEIQLTTDRLESRQRLEQGQLRKKVKTHTEEPSDYETTLTMTFEETLTIGETLKFQSIRLFQPRAGLVGTVYSAEPVVEIPVLSSLELHSITFDSAYYRDSRGRKKLESIANEIRRLSLLNKEIIQSIHAVKLWLGDGRTPPRLHILMEQSPATSMKLLLGACGTLSVERSIHCVEQILRGLHEIHKNGLFHGCLSCAHIGIQSASSMATLKIKISGTFYVASILRLHKSNPFGLTVENGTSLHDSWLSKEMIDYPSRSSALQDLHLLGIIALQFHFGLSVTDRYMSASTAVVNLPTPYKSIVQMLIHPGESVSCQSVLDIVLSAKDLPQSDETQSPWIISEPLKPVPVMGSRYRSDWDELDFLGSGGFGEVVKARNKLDGRIYAVKKIRLRPRETDDKIFREVNALAKLSHRSIIRYYTAWVETANAKADRVSRASDSTSDSDADTTSFGESSNMNIAHVNWNDVTGTSSHHESFPGIYFTDNSQITAESDEDSSAQRSLTTDATLLPASTLYIQMEFVENLTLKERVVNGLDEDEAWRLLHQLVDALVHMEGLGIIHRDIKLGNIFIDANGDCKIGDFGLATSSMAAIQPPPADGVFQNTKPDMTMGIGTMLYVAPELVAHSLGAKDHTKADVYSLGIVFFEMNFAFATGSERVAVIEALRAPEICFPLSWEAHRIRQKKLISMLLNHDARERPSALELSRNPLLPTRVGDESLEAALRAISREDSVHYASVLTLMFKQDRSVARSYVYDSHVDRPARSAFDDLIEEQVKFVFRLHGAVHIEPPLLSPFMPMQQEISTSVCLMDQHGEVLTIPKSLLPSFARLAAKSNVRRIKRYHIGNVYRRDSSGSHPAYFKAAIFDIISPSLSDSVEAAMAECMLVVNEIIIRFPAIPEHQFRVSHSSVVDSILQRIPDALRSETIELLSHSFGAFLHTRTQLVQSGISRPLIDEIEVLMTPADNVETIGERAKKASLELSDNIKLALQEIRATIATAMALGLRGKVSIQALNLRHRDFKHGVQFEVVKESSKLELLAAGGRYDHLFRQFATNTVTRDPLRAVAVQVALDKLGTLVSRFQSSQARSLVKEQRSFGYWSPRRCDVYIVSHHLGQQVERYELANLCWTNGISADFMYESSVEEGAESIHEHCVREGILFIVHPRPRSTRLGVPSCKVTSTLTRNEYEVSKSELITFLSQHLQEQRRTDSTTAGTDTSRQPSGPHSKDNLQPLDVLMLLPPDRKQLKNNKRLLLDKAHEVASAARSAFTKGMVPTVAVQVTSLSFTAMTEGKSWLTDDEAFRAVAATFQPPGNYATQIRESIVRHLNDGASFVLLLSLRDDKVHLFNFT